MSANGVRQILSCSQIVAYDIDEIRTKNDLFNWISSIVKTESVSNFGFKEDDPFVLEAIEYFYSSDNSRQNFRFDDLLLSGITVKSGSRILDMASGFGQFVLAALERGFDCWGLEPDENRLRFVNKKIELFGFPSSFKDRFARGFGENIPFLENSFDFITSFQTLEHVQNLDAVTSNMIRVVKSGGGIHIRCPDYFGTYEGHYRMPWLPFPFSKLPMKMILRILGKPTSGLDRHISYITKLGLIKSFTKAAKLQNARIMITDYENGILEAGMRRRGIPSIYLTLNLIKLIITIRDIFRREKSINLFIRVVKNNELERD